MCLRNLNLAFLCIIPLIGVAQDDDCLPFSEASSEPAHVQCVIMDCRTENCSELLSSLGDYSELQRLELINMSRDCFPKDLSMARHLKSVTLTQSPGINYTNLFRKMSLLPELEELVLDNDGIKVLPKSIQMLSGLTRLVIRNNESFEIEKSITILSHLQKLKELAVPINQLADIPQNIGLLKNLEVLDLSDNQLSDLPRQMKDMDSLEVLNIEKNIFINPTKTLEKLKGLNIKYLSMDLGLTDKDKEKLSRIFPKAEIVEVVDTMSAEEEDNLNFSENFGYDLDLDTIEYEYKTIMIGEAGFRALSDAYMHYPLIFDRPNFKSSFDSLLFEERYLDTTYCNVYKVQPWNEYHKIRLYLFKGGVKGEIWFDFHLDYKSNDVPTANPYITKYNPELLAFLGLKWVYQGELSKQQFISKYIKNINGDRYYTDARVYYNEKDMNFTIELKDGHGFTHITAVARNRNRLITLEKAQESYSTYYDRYVKALDNRRRRFHKKLLRDKSAYDVTLERSIVSAWESFRKVYMSPEEQKMSRKTWMEYYDQVLANETKALENALPVSGLIQRSLELRGFTDGNDKPITSDTNQLKGIYAQFRDDQGNMAAVVKVILMNLKEKTYRFYDGSLGLNSIRLYFSIPAEYTIIAEFRNGDMGILSPQSFSNQNLTKNKEYVFTMKRLPKRLSTIGEILSNIGI